MIWSRAFPPIIVAIVALWSNETYATETIVAVRQEQLFQQLDVEPRDRTASLGTRGVSHKLRSAARRLTRIDLDLAVHPREQTAGQLMDRIADSMSTGPGRTNEVLGERRFVWGSPASEGGYILFARKNVTISIVWDGEFSNGLALAQAIDEKIRDDRQIAPLGTFADTPEIVSTGVPATATASPPAATRPSLRAAPQYAAPTYIPITPVIRGLGPREGLRIRLLENGLEPNFVATTSDGRSNPKIDFVDAQGRPRQRDRTTEEDGRFQFVVPCTPRQLKLEMVVANSDNVFVTKLVEVEVRPRE